MRTWAPKGKAPIIQFHFNWTHISVTRRPVAHELHVPAARRQHQERTARRVPQGAARAPQATAVDHLGRLEGAPRQARARSPGLHQWRHSDGVLAIVFAGPESGRVSSGLGSSATRWPNFCPANLDELNITARAQVEKRPTTAVDHPSVLGSGRLVVISPFREYSQCDLGHLQRLADRCIHMTVKQLCCDRSDTDEWPTPIA